MDDKKYVSINELLKSAEERSYTGEANYEETKRHIFIGYYTMPSYYGDPQGYEPDQEEFYSTLFRIDKKSGLIESCEYGDEYDGCYLKPSDLSDN